MIKTPYLFAFGFLVFVCTLVIFAPASLAPRFVQLPVGVKFEALEGMLWNPTFKQIHVQSLPLGDMTVSLSPLSLFTGGASGVVSVTGNRFYGSGWVTIADTLLLENFNFTGQTKVNFGDTSVASRVTLQGERLAWNNQGQCVAAQARLITDSISVVLADLRSDINETVADITCEDGNLQVSFSQNLGVGTLSGSGVVVGASTLSLALVLRFADQAAISEVEVAFLQDLGFSQAEDGWHSEVTMQ